MKFLSAQDKQKLSVSKYCSLKIKVHDSKKKNLMGRHSLSYNTTYYWVIANFWIFEKCSPTHDGPACENLVQLNEAKTHIIISCSKGRVKLYKARRNTTCMITCAKTPFKLCCVSLSNTNF